MLVDTRADRGYDETAQDGVGPRGESKGADVAAGEIDMNAKVVGLSARVAAAACLATLAWARAGVGACQIMVSSRPNGATVFVDERERGRTPIVLHDLSTGRHVLRIVLDGHKPWTKTVKLRPGARAITADLLKEEGAKAAPSAKTTLPGAGQGVRTGPSDVKKGTVWLAVGTPALMAGLAPLADSRRAEGFRVILSDKSVQEAIISAPQRPEFILLVGDCELGKEKEPWHVPTKRITLYRWQPDQPRQFASDAAWGDLDGDGLPDVPVGRIPARTRQEVELVCRKIVAFERQTPGEIDLRVPVWLGAPDFPPPMDSMASGMFMDYVKRYAPPWSCLWLTSSDTTSPFCGWPSDKPQVFTRELRRGGCLAFLSGHGREQQFFSMKYRGRDHYYTAGDARSALSKAPPTAPLFFITCLAGNYAGRSPCMTESFLFFEGGPVATIGSSTVSHPLTNALTTLSLVQSIKGGRPRLGQLWLDAQRGMLGMRDATLEQFLSNVEGTLEPRINVDKLKRDQTMMYAILGDPATRLRLPGRLEATVARTDVGWRWKAERPEGATQLFVGVRPARLSFPAAAGQLDETRANDLLKAANARFGFKSLPSVTGAAPWEGVVPKKEAARGKLLRLVATGPGLIRVAVLKLK